VIYFVWRFVGEKGRKEGRRGERNEGREGGRKKGRRGERKRKEEMKEEREKERTEERNNKRKIGREREKSQKGIKERIIVFRATIFVETSLSRMERYLAKNCSTRRPAEAVSGNSLRVQIMRVFSYSNPSILTWYRNTIFNNRQCAIYGCEVGRKISRATATTGTDVGFWPSQEIVARGRPCRSGEATERWIFDAKFLIRFHNSLSLVDFPATGEESGGERWGV